MLFRHNLSIPKLKRLHYYLEQTLVLRSMSSKGSIINGGPESPVAKFVNKHIGPTDADIGYMLNCCGFQNINDFVEKVIPANVRFNHDLHIEAETSEYEVIKRLRRLMDKNKIWRSYIGQGYYGTITPSCIRRNIFESPGWYTSYTPYQAEISQGRLESLFNFQTMISDLTGLEIANASLLDEGTAAAEAVTMAVRSTEKMKVLVDIRCHPQTIDVILTRAEGLGIEIVTIDSCDNVHLRKLMETGNYAAVVVQYPDTEGNLYHRRIRSIAEVTKQNKGFLIVATDLLALTLVESPGQLGADVVIGSAQRFGLPLGFGGPHAAFLATKKNNLRLMPGRIVGLSRDANKQPAFRLTLQVREQHIRREKATSNICTAQVLLANMATFYAIYHGPDGLRDIASRIHRNTLRLSAALEHSGHQLCNKGPIFDTLKIIPNPNCGGVDSVHQRAIEKEINLRYYPDGKSVGVSLDETLTPDDFYDLLYIFSAKEADLKNDSPHLINNCPGLARQPNYLKQPVFNTFHSETSLVRYMKNLESRDISLVHAAIPLGSCTLKLNGTTELLPCSWDSVTNLHPFVPSNQTLGYLQVIAELENDLKEITGFDYMCLTPSSGAQGEYAGLKAIIGYFKSQGQEKRKVCLIPTSSHGTNPASARMAGMIVQAVKTTRNGCVDIGHLKERIDENTDTLGAIMLTYPSTFGVFDDDVTTVCELVHEAGGQVYIDGANMNAQVGLCRPGDIGADVSHFNLHKTFSIPHGGGGPGVGPIGVKAHLAPFLPRNAFGMTNMSTQHITLDTPVGHYTICSAPFGSASLLPISWIYMKLLGPKGVRKASEIALLNANYMMKRLRDHYNIKYVNDAGMCAHEFILDCAPFAKYGVEVVDIAKRLMDYGFHSPTMSWPVVSSLMIEPTESEPLTECDQLCDALIMIREEIDKISRGEWGQKCNPLKMAPHTIEVITASDWNRPYTRKEAAFPAPWQSGTTEPSSKRLKIWPTVNRVDDAYGDRNVVCRW